MESFKIYYMTPEHFPKGSLRCFPKRDLSTHIEIVEIELISGLPLQQLLEIVYERFQAFNLSSMGRRLIQDKGVNHLSMSPGDLIKHKDKYYLVDFIGFREIEHKDWK